MRKKLPPGDKQAPLVTKINEEGMVRHAGLVTRLNRALGTVCTGMYKQAEIDKTGLYDDSSHGRN